MHAGFVIQSAMQDAGFGNESESAVVTGMDNVRRVMSPGKSKVA